MPEHQWIEKMKNIAKRNIFGFVSFRSGLKLHSKKKLIAPIMNSLESIAKTSVTLLLLEPFYGHFMMGLPKELTSSKDSIGLSLNNGDTLKLLIHEQHWNSLSKDRRYGLIKHEVLHIVLQHIYQIKEYPNKRIYGIAADLVVNQYIKKNQLEPDAIHIDRFENVQYSHGITLERDMDVGYYYRMIHEVLRCEAKCDFQSACKKCNGGGSGRGEKKGSDQINLSDLLNDDACNGLERHKHWEKFDKMNEGNRKVCEYQTNRLMQETAKRIKHIKKAYGTMPAGLILMIEAILLNLKPAYNWRRVLRLFATTSNQSYLKNTIRKASKRYGTVPGIRVKRRNKILVAIDTSGSVDEEELMEFFSEIYFIWRQGATIEIVECDTHIHSTYPYKGVTPSFTKGGGGTEFDQPLIYGNESFKPDALMYFTDGYAPAPDVLPRYPILWIISSNGILEEDWDFLPGRKLKL